MADGTCERGVWVVAAVALALMLAAVVLPIRGRATREANALPVPSRGHAATQESGGDRPQQFDSERSRSPVESVVAGRGASVPVDEPLALPAKRRVWGVFIGIDSYAGGETGLRPLEFAVNDARALRDLLRDEFDYVGERTVFLSNSEATRTAIERLFVEQLPSWGIAAEDGLLVFFAGHGMIVPRTREGFLAAVDSRADALETTCVSAAWLRDRLAALPCRHKLLILDSCYSGSLFLDKPAASVVTLANENAGGRGQAPRKSEGAEGSGTQAASRNPLVRSSEVADPSSDNLKYFLRQPSFWGMSAGRLTPVADGLGADRHSVFTATLLRVLRERADSPRSADHAFTFRQLASQVEASVMNVPGSHQIPDWGRLSDGEGDYVFQPTVRRSTPREVSRRRLVKRFVTNGEKSVAAGELLNSLPWFAEALRLEGDQPESADVHRRRIKAVLNQAPDLVQALLLEQGVMHVSFSPDGKLLATAGADGSARAWHIDTGKPACPPLLHDDSVVEVWFSADGTRLLTAATDRTGRNGQGEARVWALATGEPITPPLRHDGVPKTDPKIRQAQKAKHPDYVLTNVGLIKHARFSPDGTQVLTASDDRTARVWDSATGKPILPPLPHNNEVVMAVFSPDGRWILTAESQGLVRVWDAKTGKLQWQRESPLSPPGFSSDSRQVAISLPDNRVEVLEAATGQSVATIIHAEPVTSLQFSPDGHRLLLVGRHTLARVWDLREQSWSGGLLQHAGLKSGAFAPDGRAVLTFGEGVRWWNAINGVPLATIPEACKTGTLSPDGRLVAIIGAAGVSVWEWRLDWPLTLSQAGQDGWTLGALSADGQLVAGHLTVRAERSVHGRIAVWDVTTGQAQGAVLAVNDPLKRLQFSADGRLLLSMEEPTRRFDEPPRGTSRLWNLATGESNSPPIVSAGQEPHAAISPDGLCWAATGADQTVRLYDSRSGIPLSQPLAHPGRVTQIQFAPSGDELICVSGNEPGFNPNVQGSVTVWNCATGEKMTEFQQLGQVKFLTISPSGDRAVTLSERFLGGASYESSARLWNLDNGQPLGDAVPDHRLNANLPHFLLGNSKMLMGGKLFDSQTGQPLLSLSATGHVSPDGRLFAAWSRRELGEYRSVSQVRLWDAESRTPITPLLEAGGEQKRAIFSPDGRWLAAVVQINSSGDRHGLEVRVWETSSGDLLIPPYSLPTSVYEVEAIRFDASREALQIVTRGAVGIQLVRLELRDDRRLSDELIRHCQWLSGYQIDDLGGLEKAARDLAARPDSSRRGRELLEPRPLGSGHPSFKQPLPHGRGSKSSQDSATRWHRQQADASHDDGHWFGERWHLDQLRTNQGSDSSWLARHGQCCVRLQDWAAAEADYRQLTQQQPKSEWAWAGLGEALIGLCDWTGAREAFTQALTLEGKPWDCRIGRALAFAELTDEVNARKDLQAANRLYSDHLQSDDLSRRLDQHERAGNWRATLLIVDRLLELPIVRLHSESSLHAHRGFALVQLGRGKEALAALDAAIQRDEKVAWFWTTRAEAHALLEAGSTAQRDLKQSVQLGSNAEDGWRRIIGTMSREIERDPQRSFPWFFRGTARLSVGQAAEARADLQRAAELNPQGTASANNSGYASLLLEDWSEAEASYSRAIERDQKGANGWMMRGIARAALGQFPEAVDDWDQAVQLSPDASSLWTDLRNELNDLTRRSPQQSRLLAARGWSHFQLEAEEAALKDFDAALGQPSEDWWPFWARGRVLLEGNTWAKSESDFTRAIELANEEPDPYFDRGRVRLRRRQFTEALADFTESVRLLPESHEARLQRGVALLALERSAEALADLTHVIEQTPDNWEAWRHRGTAHAQRGAWQLAANDLAEACELGADEPSVWYERALLALQLKDPARYAALCATLVRRFASGAPDDVDPRLAELVLRTCSLAPGGLSDERQLTALSRRLQSLTADRPASRAVLATIEMRAGRLSEARAFLVPKGIEPNGIELSPADRCRLGLIHVRLGDLEAARHVAAGISIVGQSSQPRGLPADKPVVPWTKRLEEEWLLQELKDVLTMPTP